MPIKVLVVDDEKDIGELVRYNLEKAGVQCLQAADGSTALRLIREHRPDLLILDLMLPGMDGLEVCRQLRRDPVTAGMPIIMLTARAEEVDRVVGLEVGADDYVVKPFSPRELGARVQAILRRVQGRPGPSTWRIGALEVDEARHQVRVKGGLVELTAKEFGLLCALIGWTSNMPCHLHKEAHMITIPSAARPLLLECACAFTRPTFQRWQILLLTAILTTGRRTILNLLRTVGTLAPGHPSSSHRVFSRRRWSTWELARVLSGFIRDHWVPQGSVYLAGEDTVDEHPGRKVFAKARHRDPVRSTHPCTAFRWGHTWVVLSILVPFPCATRPWALPVPVRWVFVHDLTGTHRDEYFFTTDRAMTPKQIIEASTGRWSLETTFQELRAYLGLETTRGWTEATVLRMAPCLFGRFSVVALRSATRPVRWSGPARVPWVWKHDVTFSDAMTAVRRWLWVEWIFVTCGQRETFAKLSRPLRELLLHGLAPAA